MWWKNWLITRLGCLVTVAGPRRPLINQLHLSKQLYIRNFRFLWHASRSDNCIVKACMNNAKYSSNSCIRYKLSIFRNHFSLDMDSDLKLSAACLSVNRLDLAQQVILLRMNP